MIVDANIFYPIEVKNEIDQIFLQYPYIIDKEIYDFWLQNIRHTSSSPTDSMITRNAEFVDMCQNAYSKKLEEYRKIEDKTGF